MIFRLIVWMVIVFVAAKIIGQVIKSLRLLMTPNKNVSKHQAGTSAQRESTIEDVPYEEVKDQK